MKKPHWSRSTETGEYSEGYESLISAVNRIILQNGQHLVSGASRVVAARIVYELIDILEMMPKSIADEYIDRMNTENGVIHEDSASLGSAASAG